MSMQTELVQYLKELRLPSIRSQYIAIAQEADKESLSYEQFLHLLFQEEYQSRMTNKIERYLRESRLPLEKSLANFNLKRLPQKVQQQVPKLLEGAFLHNKENILVFGSPGTGKTHLLCAIAQALIQKKKRVFFCKCALLVQDLLIAKKDLHFFSALLNVANIINEDGIKL